MMSDHLVEQERRKYEKVWTYEGYRDQADGDPLVARAFDLMGCQPGESLIDWGCGKGTPAQQFKNRGLKVTGVDIAHNCRDAGVDIELYIGCLWDRNLPATLEADYSFCTDVLEHLPPARLTAALKNIEARTRKSAVIQVCTVLDSWGGKIEPPEVLHLSVLSDAVWQSKLERIWRKVTPVEIKRKARCCFFCEK